MAGPTTSILLPSIPSSKQWTVIQDSIQSISNLVKGDDFWVVNTRAINGNTSTSEGRPFGLSRNEINAEYAGYSKEQLSRIESFFSSCPMVDLALYAMCNSNIQQASTNAQ